MKKLHRLILTSAAYRQATLTACADLTLAEQTFCGHLPRRIDAEQIRDAMLLVSGELRPYASQPGVSGDEPVPSIQVRNQRNQPDEWLSAFDGPDMFNSCARRYVTTTPLQSLLIVNSPWSLQRAAALASRVRERAAADTERWASLAFRLTLARQPDDEELAEAQRFLDVEQSQADERLADLCHVLLCSNEFVYLD